MKKTLIILASVMLLLSCSAEGYMPGAGEAENPRDRWTSPTPGKDGGDGGYCYIYDYDEYYGYDDSECIKIGITYYGIEITKELCAQIGGNVVNSCPN
ncbi:MAG: hypothetical protein LBB36_03790 [Fibromonadaceae bacterium]|jgi:hypothetical protein|nr:hypothetical protein [Fibromonadaceae bacterium]